MTNQERICQQLHRYEIMEAQLESVRDQLTPLEALYVERIIEFRREQLVKLAHAGRGGGILAKMGTFLAARMGAAAAAYEQKLNREVQDAVTQGH